MDFKKALVENLSKFNDTTVLKESKYIKEDTEEYLEPRFDSRASFYKKARVVKKDNGDEELYSYDTHVGGMRDGKPYSKGKWSQTTSRHQAEYFRQKGYEPKEVPVEEGKKITEEYYGKGIYGEIEEALVESGFDIERFNDAGVLTKNLGWIVRNELGQTAEISCDGTWLDDEEDLDESKKLQEEVSNEMYQMAEEVLVKLNTAGNPIMKEDFDQYVFEAAQKVLGIKDIDELYQKYPDWDADIRGILGYYGWGTDFESGDLSRYEESLDKKGENKDA